MFLVFIYPIILIPDPRSRGDGTAREVRPYTPQRGVILARAGTQGHS